jgi:hypothetical protein
MPIKDITIPTIARREGFSLKNTLEISVEKMGVVLTKTVAFKIVVSLTAEKKEYKA